MDAGKSRRWSTAPEAERTEAHEIEKLELEKKVPAKLKKDLREFWGAKSSVGFAGQQLAPNTRLSKGEAQATLQRLIAAGGDFDEVRRLRKLIAELD